MLPAPSPLSRICGHSHFKKFWLMQTQKEAQANILAEKNASLAKPTSCCMPSAPVRLSDGKSSSRWFSGAPSMRTVLRGLSSTKNLSSPIGAGKHASLVTCAESLSSPELVNISLHEKQASLNRKDENNNTDPGLQCYLGEGNEDTHRMDLPVAARSTSVTSSSWESPSRQTYYDISCDDLVRKTDLSATMDIDGDELMNNPHEQMRLGEWDFSKSQQLRNTSMEKAYLDSIEGISRPEMESDSPPLQDYFCGNLKEPGRNSESLRSQVRGCRSHGRDMMQTCLDERQGRNLEVDDVDEDHDVEGGAALFEDEKLQDLNKFESNIGLSNLRACSHCGTTKTPLWRSGPQGPKSLCNACGIRFKKSRRYTGFVGESLTSPATPNSRSFSRSLKRKQESSVESHPVHYHGEDADMVSVNLHKRSRWPTRLSLKSGCSRHKKEDHTGSTAESCLTWNLHSPSSVSFSPRSVYRQYVKDSKQICEQINLARMFARDEDEEAAVLLMALSCGFVNA